MQQDRIVKSGRQNLVGELFRFGQVGSNGHTSLILFRKERQRCVQVAREVKEEAGVEVENVHILGSQPWPIGESTVLRINAALVNDPGNCLFDTPATHVHLLLCICWQSQLCALAGFSAARLHAGFR